MPLKVKQRERKTRNNIICPECRGDTYKLTRAGYFRCKKCGNIFQIYRRVGDEKT